MLLRKCFTHASYAHENGVESNELLEFFGDAIIEFTVTEFLVKNFSGDEGKLTARRASIVSNEALLKAVKKLGLGEFILLGKGLSQTDMYEGKLYASLYESLVAGIYLDGGIEPAKRHVLRFVQSELAHLENVAFKDYKTELQEIIQRNPEESVNYILKSESGPDHNKVFEVEVHLNSNVIGTGKGKNKKQAEQMAAKQALELMGTKI